MKQTLTVFICSTFSDLIDEREAVIEAIKKLQHQHDSMEYFGARSDLPIETCLEEVRRSDVLIVIIGHRYGSFVPDTKISFSESEYNEGYRLKKPCLVYIKDDNIPILPKFIERDSEKIGILDKFKETLRMRHTVASFQNVHDLALGVATALSRTAQAIEETIRMETEEQSRRVDSPFSELNGLMQDALSKGISHQSLISTIRQAITILLSNEGRRKPRIFFSHSHKDKNIVRAVATGLKKLEIEVWIDEQNISYGENIVDTITKGLDTSDFLAFFMSRQSLESSWSQKELNVVMSRRLSNKGGAVILPILLENVEIPALLRDVMYIDLRDGDIQKGVNNLAIAIKHHMKEKKL